MRPRSDAGISPLAPTPPLIVGQTQEFSFDVYTGPLRPASAVRVDLPRLSDFGLESLTTTIGTCAIGTQPGMSTGCDLGNLPPSASARITMRFRPTLAGRGVSGWLRVSTIPDVNSSNDSRELRLTTYQAGDAEVRIASPTVAGTVGTTVALPRITVNTLVQAEDLYLEMSLPAFAAIETMSNNAFCSGTTQLVCYLGTRASAESLSYELTLRLNGPGTFTSDLRVRSANDTNVANDTTTLQIQSNAAAGSSTSSSSSGSSSGGGKGGGGGRLEWLVLVPLAGIAATRGLASARASWTRRSIL